jgi:hypothetical protein
VEPVCVRDDLPPHVTVLIPCPGDLAAIAEVLAPFEQFDVTFSQLERFPRSRAGSVVLYRHTRGAHWDPVEAFEL